MGGGRYLAVRRVEHTNSVRLTFPGGCAWAASGAARRLRVPTMNPRRSTRVIARLPPAPRPPSPARSSCPSRGTSSPRWSGAPGLRRVTGSAIELAEAEVAVGDERAHAELVGPGEGLAVVLLGRLQSGGSACAAISPRRRSTHASLPRSFCRCARSRARRATAMRIVPAGRPGDAPRRGRPGTADGWRCPSPRGRPAPPP